MTRHLTDEEIEQYLAGTPMLPAPGIEEDHLQTCPACRLRLERTDARALELAARATFFPGDGSLWHPTLAQLVAYARGEADEFDREILEGHLEDCPACQADLRDVREFRESQSLLPPRVYAPEHAPALMERVRGWRAVAPLRLILPLAGAAVAVAVALTIRSNASPDVPGPGSPGASHPGSGPMADMPEDGPGPGGCPGRRTTCSQRGRRVPAPPEHAGEQDGSPFPAQPDRLDPDGQR